MFEKGKELSLVPSPKKPEGAKWADAPRVTTRFKHEADGTGKLKPGYNQMYVISAEGGTARAVTKGAFRHASAPHWTADSKSLVFSGNRQQDWEYDFRNSEIYKAEIATGKVVALTDRNGPDKDIAISSNGQIAYTGYDLSLIHI